MIVVREESQLACDKMLILRHAKDLFNTMATCESRITVMFNVKGAAPTAPLGIFMRIACQKGFAGRFCQSEPILA